MTSVNLAAKLLIRFILRPNPDPALENGGTGSGSDLNISFPQSTLTYKRGVLFTRGSKQKNYAHLWQLLVIFTQDFTVNVIKPYQYARKSPRIQIRNLTTYRLRTLPFYSLL
jgi:hypothetical protein